MPTEPPPPEAAVAGAEGCTELPPGEAGSTSEALAEERTEPPPGGAEGSTAPHLVKLLLQQLVLRSQRQDEPQAAAV